MQIEHLSYSSLSTLRRCGEQFRLVKQVGLREPPSWAQVGGSAVHNATEARDKLNHFGIVTGDPLEFQAALDKEVAKQEERSGIPRSEWKMSGRAPNKQGEKWWRDNGPGMVQSWEDWLGRSGFSIWVSPDGEPGIEIPVEGEVGGGKIVGFVDRVLVSGYGLGLVDLKSGVKIPETMEQNGLYGILLRRKYPGEDFRWGSFFMNRDGKCTDPEYLSGWEQSLEYDYRVAWETIDRELFLPSPGNHCDFMCGVKDYCRLKGTADKRNLYIPQPGEASK